MFVNDVFEGVDLVLTDTLELNRTTAFLRDQVLSSLKFPKSQHLIILLP